MKPILKNFTGSLNTDYRIKPGLKGCVATINLYLRIPNTDNFVFADHKIGLFNPEEESASVGYHKALIKANEAWGLDLVKEQLNIVA